MGAVWRSATDAAQVDLLTAATDTPRLAVAGGVVGAGTLPASSGLIGARMRPKLGGVFGAGTQPKSGGVLGAGMVFTSCPVHGVIVFAAAPAQGAACRDVADTSIVAEPCVRSAVASRAVAELRCLLAWPWSLQGGSGDGVRGAATCGRLLALALPWSG
jgi:hypothetical protein